MSRFAALIFGILLTLSATAAELFGLVDAVSGMATVTDTTGASRPVTAGMSIFAGQSLQTATDSEVHIVTEDSGLIALRPNSSFRIERYQARGKSTDEVVFSLLRGALRSVTGWIAKRNTSAYRLNTPTATIGVRGTDHETTVVETALDGDQPGTFDTVNEGVTLMQTPLGEVEIHPGEFAFAPREAGVAPALLAQRPGFLARRMLRIEERIQQRKESLFERVQQRWTGMHGDLRDNRGEQKTESKNRREAVKQKLEQRRLRERRNP